MISARDRTLSFLGKTGRPLGRPLIERPQQPFGAMGKAWLLGPSTGTGLRLLAKLAFNQK